MTVYATGPRTSFLKREGFAGLGMLSRLVVQSDQHVIYRLKAGGGGGGGGREAKASLEETDRERLP